MTTDPTPTACEQVMAALERAYRRGYSEGAEDALTEGDTPHPDTQNEGWHNFAASSLNLAPVLAADYLREKARADAAEAATRQAIVDDLADLYQRRVATRKGKRPNSSDQIIYAVMQRIAGVDPARAALKQKGTQHG